MVVHVAEDSIERCRQHRLIIEEIRIDICFGHALEEVPESLVQHIISRSCTCPSQNEDDISSFLTKVSDNVFTGLKICRCDLV